METVVWLVQDDFPELLFIALDQLLNSRQKDFGSCLEECTFLMDVLNIHILIFCGLDNPGEICLLLALWENYRVQKTRYTTILRLQSSVRCKHLTWGCFAYNLLYHKYAYNHSL